MRQRLVLPAATLALAAAVATQAIGGAVLDLRKSATQIFDLKAGATYRASLFVPSVRITIPVAGWQGSQHVSNGYHWFFLAWRDRGGMPVISAPATTQSVAATVHRLKTERAAGTNVGISVKSVTTVRFAGFVGQQLDGTVVGRFGHTFAPFSTSTGGASAAAGDHVRVPDNRAFRIIVLNVRGKPIVFIMDSGHTPSFDPTFLSATTKLLKMLRFTG